MEMTLPAIRWPLNQKCVYWEPVPVTDSPVETVSYKPPVIISCRWDDEATQIITRDGKIVNSRATVMVDRGVKLEGVLWFAQLRDIKNHDDPFANGDQDNPPGKILKTSTIPDIDAREALYRAFV